MPALLSPALLQFVWTNSSMLRQRALQRVNFCTILKINDQNFLLYWIWHSLKILLFTYDIPMSLLARKPKLQISSYNIGSKMLWSVFIFHFNLRALLVSAFWFMERLFWKLCHSLLKNRYVNTYKYVSPKLSLNL